MIRSESRLVRVVEAPARAATRGYVNLDNAATTPAAEAVARAVNALLEVYGSIHRGAGPKSVQSTLIYEGTFGVIRSFVGAAEGDDLVAVGVNATGVINRLAQGLRFGNKDIVLLSEMEHSSNVLPWRKYAHVVAFQSTSEGRMDLNSLESALSKHAGRVRLVAVTGASNVTGYLPRLAEVAALAHRYGAEVFVDASQLAPHRAIRMRNEDPALDLDHVAFSGHKLYAPFGVGVLVARRHALESLPPDLPGGGTVEMVTATDQIWASVEARITPGTPNVVGLVALAAAMRVLQEVGFDAIRKHEDTLVAAGLEVLGAVPGVKLHAQGAFGFGEDRLPVFPFTVEGYPHAKVAAVLGYEHGIAVRSGHLCQYEFMRRQLGISESDQARVEADLRRGDRRSMYGMVRASCGACSSVPDLEALGTALGELVARGPRREYTHVASSGMFVPVGDESKAVALPEDLAFLSPAVNQH